MATKIYTNPLGWHEGEHRMHQMLHVPEGDNPSSPGLSAYAQRLLHISSMLAIGTLDEEGRPWTTLLGGEPGFAQSLGRSIIGVQTTVGKTCDPVIEALVREKGQGKVMSALGIHLATRDRVKLSGRLLGGGLIEADGVKSRENEGAAELQMAFAIESSLGNCPKYLNEKRIIPTPPRPHLLSSTLPLPAPALALLAKADTFFISASAHAATMSTNHRGGSPGFVRVASNTAFSCILIYPEFSGNRLYQTLGNLYTTPKAGLVFPDFDTGDVLYITGTTEITHGTAAADVLPRSNLLVKIHVTAARFVQGGLAFHGELGERSPYNPPVRYLVSERAAADAQSASNGGAVHAKLISRTLLTPTIARFRFSLSDAKAAGKWIAGQYAALAFEDELDIGYSHMRDDDPKSLNDDFVRTFTVSSSPPPTSVAPAATEVVKGGSLKEDEFEVTIRNVGSVTSFLFKVNIRSGLEVPLRGFGGTFRIEQHDDGKISPFIAGGIGITPILAQLEELNLGRVKLYWTVNVKDMELVVDTLERYPALAKNAHVFISGIKNGKKQEKEEEAIEKVEKLGAKVERRRIGEADLDKDLAETWYFCTGPALRKDLLEWLKGKTAVYEDFDY